MTEFHMRRTVRHTPAEMFALVADIEAYPQFVPLCEDLHIIDTQPSGEGEVLIADMTMAYKLFRETFRSRVTLSPGGRDNPPDILVEYLDGPFSHLENRWKFHTCGSDRTDVEFFIAYEFRKRSIQLLLGPVFDKVVRRFIDAFEARADQLYGRVAS